MTDTPKDTDRKVPRSEGNTASSAEPATTSGTKPGLPSLDELKARGWTVAPSTGRGFGLPLRKPPPKRDSSCC